MSMQGCSRLFTAFTLDGTVNKREQTISNLSSEDGDEVAWLLSLGFAGFFVFKNGSEASVLTEVPSFGTRTTCASWPRHRKH